MQALGMLQQKASLRAPKNDPAAPEITFSAEQISEAEIAIIRCALAHALWMPDTQVVTFWDMPSQRAHWVRQGLYISPGPLRSRHMLKGHCRALQPLKTSRSN